MLRTHVSTAGDPNIFDMQRKVFFVVVVFFCLAHGACNNLI